MQRLLLLILCYTLLFSAAFAAAPPTGKPAPAGEAKAPSKLQAAIEKVEAEHQEKTKDLLRKMSSATDPDEISKITAQYQQLNDDYQKKVFALAKEHAADPDAFGVLVTGVMGQDEKLAKEALALIVKHHLQNPDVGLLCLMFSEGDEITPDQEQVIDSVAKSHPDRTAQAEGKLAQVLLKKAKTNSAKPPLAKEEMAKRLAEIEKGLNALLTEYGDLKIGPTTIKAAVESNLFEIKNLSLGCVAPDIEGTDSDGKKIKLSDYRGKAVVLDFWASWCGPCMAMVPQERELVARLKDKPFAFLGVNVDDEVDQQKAAEQEHKMTWSSIHDGDEGKIGKKWNIRYYPTIFVLDAQGVIRYKDVHDKDLEKAVEELVAEATAAKEKK